MLASAGLVLLTLALPHRHVAAHQRRAPKRAGESLGGMNVLLIIADDMNTHLGCYGHSIVKSPNIDRLARGGRRFEQAYCQYPLCNPSRSSFLTGLRPEATGVETNPSRLRQEDPDVMTMPEWFRRHGYYTAGFGKIFHRADEASWNEFTQTRSWEHGKRGKEEAEESANPLLWGAVDHEDEAEQDAAAARDGARVIDQGGIRPFFLAVGFHRPHLPWFAPRRYFDMYPAARMPVFASPEDDLRDVPAVAIHRTAANLGLENPTPERQREALAAYYATVSFMDAQVGVLLASLERRGLMDRTVVIFTSDHGFHVGEHGIWGKMTLFEDAVRVPLIIAAPQVQAAGRPTPRVVELLDLFPTVADLCDLPRPRQLQGVTLRPLLEDPNASWERPAFALVRHENATGRMVRTGQWQFNEWGREAELYDVAKDPGQVRNLAGNPAFAGVAGDMRALLDHEFGATGGKRGTAGGEAGRRDSGRRPEGAGPRGNGRRRR